MVATTTEPRLALGEVAFLEVTAMVDHGAYVDWGLGKELLVPFAEQTRELWVGARHPFGLFVDKSQRLAATMRVGDLLTEGGDFELDEWVEGVRRRHAHLIRSIRRRFEALRGEDKAERRQLDGEEIDLDAQVEARADRRSGGDPSPRLFIHRRQIVVDQRVGVDDLDCRCGRIELLRGGA